MAKTTSWQRLVRSGQPYTMIRRVPEVRVDAQPDGLPTVRIEYEYAVYGFVFEEKLVPTDDHEEPRWETVWEETLICQEATLDEAHGVATEWKGSLVGNYPIR